MEEFLYKDESYAIRGAVFEVYREMGCGFLEPVYQECMEKELRRRKIPFQTEQEICIHYKDDPLNKSYRADLICYEKIILELKAVEALTDKHRAQLFNYLKATNIRLGFLINFGHYPKAEIERIIL